MTVRSRAHDDSTWSRTQNGIGQPLRRSSSSPESKLQVIFKPRFTSPEENVALLTTQIARYKEVIEKAKIKVD